jgi:AcrR family transcriptional regulator
MTRRETISNAALESFGATGEISIEDVRRLSGASIGSIYHHFGGKDGIAAALYVEILRDYQSGIARALQRAPGAEEGVKALVRCHVRWVVRNPERARFLLQSGAARVAAGEELKELNRNLSTTVGEWVEQHPAIRPLQREVFYATVIGPAQELSRHWLAGRIRSLRKLEDELAAAAWRAVRAD